MGALEDLRRLTDDASGTPQEDGRDLFRRVRRRRVRRRALGATAGSIATLLLAVTVWPGTGLRDDLVINAVGGADTLPAPAGVGAVADHLADGTPVFVTRAADGEVYVLDAEDAHLDGKLVVYCPDPQRLVDPMNGSSYRLDGSYAGGPSPSDLSHYPAEVDAAGSGVTVLGAMVPSTGRSTEQDHDAEPRCQRPVAHVPDTSARDLALHDVARPDRWSWAYVRFGPSGSSLRLCHALRGCGAAEDAADTTITQVRGNGPPLWALVRSTADGRFLARFAPPPSFVNTGPVDDPVARARQELGSSPRQLRDIWVDGAPRDVGDRGLRLWIDPEGWFSADTACGSRWGRFDLEDEHTITFHDVDDTAMTDCDDGLRRTIESFFVDGTSRTLTLDSGEIVLETEDGDRLRYEWSE